MKLVKGKEMMSKTEQKVEAIKGPWATRWWERRGERVEKQQVEAMIQEKLQQPNCGFKSDLTAFVTLHSLFLSLLRVWNETEQRGL